MWKSSESFAKPDEEKANIVCNYFSSVFNIVDDSSFNQHPIGDSVINMLSISFGK